MRAVISGDSHSSLPRSGDETAGFPLSSAQRGMWFAQQLAPQVPVCIAQYVDLRGDLDLELLRKASRTAGHEFQSAFLRLSEIDGEPNQIVDHGIDDNVDFLDLRSEPDPMAAAKAWIDENYTAPVDLTRDRLVTVWILQVEDSRFLWYSKIHHVALDGYGAMTMVNRTAELYTAELEGKDPKPASAADLKKLYSLDQEYRHSGRFETDREYWADHVRDVQGGATLANSDGATVAASKLESAALDEHVVDNLEKSDATKSATAAAVVIAAFACYLSRMTGREDVLVNIPVSARTTAVLRRSGGMLVNVAPLPIRVSPAGSIGDLVQHVQLELMGALRHQRFSIEDIRRDLTAKGLDSGLLAPMVNVMLFHQEIHLGPIAGEFNIVTSGPVDDLLVNIYQSGSPARTFIDFRGNPNRYIDADLARHHRGFIDILSAFVDANPLDLVDDVHVESAAVGRRRRLEQQQLAYWSATLADAPVGVGLGTSTQVAPSEVHPQPRLAVADTVDPGVHRRLTSDAAKKGSSLLITVHAALVALLARLSGETDIAIGARTPFTDGNTIVFRTSVVRGEPFAELASRAQDSDTAALAHADVLIADVFEELSREDLYRVVLAFGTEATPSVDTDAELVVSVDETFDALGAPQGISIRFDCEATVLDEEALRGHLARLIKILRVVSQNPRVFTDDIDVLSESERELLVPVRGGVSVVGRLLPEILVSAVDVAGVDGVALVCGGVSVSYGELDVRSSRLARLLIGRGVGVGSFVALGLRRSVESVVAVWAVAKAGGAFLPVDPSYPVDRIAHMLSDSGAVVGITAVEYVSDVGRAGDGVSWIVLDDESIVDEVGEFSGGPVSDGDRLGSVRLDDAAYLIYTSGSTGVPKGVVVTHRGLANLAEVERVRFGVTAGSRTLSFASPSFDASVLELLLAFCGGAAMVIVPTDVFGGVELAQLLREEEITHAFVTPAALASVDPAGLDSLAVVATGGDASGSDLVERWAPGRLMFNAYGPTEATVFASLSAPMSPGVPVDIGSPVLGFAVVVLDSRLQPVPVGVVGELYLAGPGLARGYHDRLGLTAERFVAAPFSLVGERMYRTGDVVRWNGSGVLEYVGRSDFQVKVRGFRIELGEIDAVIAALPEVDFVATLGVDGPGGAAVLVSYVFGVGGGLVDVDAVRDRVVSVLPAHMVPSVFVVLDSIPLTPAGKLDRRA
ncbi:amino acid adenylation domain-containing protein, partial [Rhodococcus sp. 1163]|uniref:non-ribosomal peptide synthetase n=1 Tax=Rhodococcus sp. 1163 TaxID=1905289 RepID=UPI00117AC361